MSDEDEVIEPPKAAPKSGRRRAPRCTTATTVVRRPVTCLRRLPITDSAHAQQDGDEIWVEPWRSVAFPVIKDLVVNRGALDRIIAAGGFVGVQTGSAPDANAIPVPKDSADRSMDAAACIGCGACVAACPNGSASLFTAAKISHLGLLPQGQAERYRRALSMVAQMDLEHFGGCSLFGECQAACPKEISIDFIARMHRDYLKASVTT